MRNVLLHILLCSTLVAQDRMATGRVTFVAGATVYASVGRKDGLIDSAQGVIKRSQDTVATVVLMAVSTKSSSWTILRSNRDVQAGDIVIANFKTPSVAPVPAMQDSVPSAFVSQPPRSLRTSVEETPALDVRGRVSVQYAGVRAEDSRNSSAQPGISVSLRAAMRDLPIQMILYGAHRRSVRGSLAPWESSSRPESRLYRLSLEYDDTTNVIMAGRIMPMATPTVTAVDGFSYARRFGKFFAGLSGGLEPSVVLGRDPGSIWKTAVFGGYQSFQPLSLNASLAYSRSYHKADLVREAASMSASLYLPSGFSVYTYGDFDLRPPLARNSSMDPSLTSLMLSANMRISSIVSVFAGIDAARAVPSVLFYGLIADTLFDRTLRAGINAGASLTYGGWSWTLSYAPRVLPATFGKEYSGTTSIGTYDLMNSGVDLRGTMTLNENAFSIYRSYGLNLRRTFWDVDVRLRGQLNEMRILQLKENTSSSALGLDAVLPLTRSLSLTASFDAWRGAGLSMDLLYFECSWRF